MTVEYAGTKVGPDGRRYAPGAPELTEPYVDPPEVVRARGEKVEGAIPVINEDGEPEWTEQEEGGGGISVTTAADVPVVPTSWNALSGDDVQEALTIADTIFGTVFQEIGEAASDATAALTAAGPTPAARFNYGLETGQLPIDGTDTVMGYQSSVIRNVNNGEIVYDSGTSEVVLAIGEYLVSYTAIVDYDTGAANESRLYVHLSPFNSGQMLGSKGCAPRALFTQTRESYIRFGAVTRLKPYVKLFGGIAGPQIACELNIVKLG